MVNSQSGTIIPASLRPNIEKNTSMWKPYSSPPHVDPTASNDSLIDSNYWSGVLLGYGSAWPAEVYDNTSVDIPAIQEYLMDRLGLDPWWITSNGQGEIKVLTLHEIENALAAVLAASFWIGGNINTDPLTTKYGYTGSPNLIQGIKPVTTTGFTTVYSTSPACRLHLDLRPIIVGLGTSILMAALASIFSRNIPRCQVQLDGTGFLHVLWLARNRPTIGDSLKQIYCPTDRELRAAGMQNVQFM
ncbi:hypothetical protein K438DRAFT_1991562 [Mycena galopus ATCC 62051]|nr:hypothetical protein K438DRAFT_1991562 [Mycena galopus ATCC 62051]